MRKSKVVDIAGKTFVIDIKSFENNSWQGTICWTQTKQTVPFRSALELIKLLDSAVAVSEDKKSKWYETMEEKNHKAE